MQPFPEELMTMWKIGRDVGNRETTVPTWSTSVRDDLFDL